MMKVIKRDDTSFELTFKDVDGNPINITGGIVFFTVKKNLSDSDEDAVIAVEITAFNAPLTGVALLVLSSADTDIEARTYLYDIQLKLGGRVTSSDRGKFVVTQDVTIRTA